MHALLSRRYYLINNVNAETRTTEQTILSRADSPPTDDGNKTYYKHKYYLVQQLSLSLSLPILNYCYVISCRHFGLNIWMKLRNRSDANQT